LSIQIDYKGKVATLSRSSERTESLAGRREQPDFQRRTAVAGHLGFALKPHNPPNPGFFTYLYRRKRFAVACPLAPEAEGDNLVVRAKTDVMMV